MPGDQMQQQQEEEGEEGREPEQGSQIGKIWTTSSTKAALEVHIKVLGLLLWLGSTYQ
jgi:hypothetical protein